MAGQPEPEEAPPMWREPAQPPLGALGCALLPKVSLGGGRSRRLANGLQDEQTVATPQLGLRDWASSVLRRPAPYSRAPRPLSFSARHYYPSEWTVQLGELTSRPAPWNLRAYSNRYKVRDIIVNPDALGVLHNDIALLRLASSVAYNAYIQPICVESSTFTFVHRPDCWVTGWGLISPSGTPLSPPYNLQEAQVTILNNTRCNYLFEQPSSRSMIRDSMFCAGAEDGSVDTCKGDSGGPLVCDKDGLWYQVGIVSWGMDCGQPNRPGVYTNISVYFQWIQRVMSHSTPRPNPSQLLLLLALLWAP
ncbi:serine protease 41-like isoform X2 [Hylobates moloch]|uniref:serine protease 41-like isoform X2 n=1 Tax=Hylobates moloch TaxID=81572 RepID=UPI002675BE5A|nr:serine protease 41-like isoform X2 [Hylobates moloch]